MDRPFYSITFGTKNTWDEWGLMPIHEGKIEIATPTTKTEHVEIAGSDNALDLTEVLTGYPLFNSRQGSLKFRFIDNGIPVRSRFNNLKNFLHGKYMRMEVEDEPEYYYMGRWHVGNFEPKNGNWGEVTLSYVLDAYKNDLIDSTEPWLWDPFNFETGVIREYGEVTVTHDNVTAVTIVGSPKPTIPTFIVTKVGEGQIDDGGTWFPIQMTVDSDPKIYALNEGFNTVPQLVLFNREYTLFFSNNDATVIIDYRGGSL